MTDELTLHLVARWQAGDQSAADELFGRYAERLVLLVRGSLSPKLAHRLDPEDVVQSSCRSFFIGARDGRYVLEQSGDLWRLLAGITLNKLGRQIQRHTAQKRSVAREQGLPEEAGLVRFPAPAPTPEELTIAADLLHCVLTDFLPAHRRMIELRLQGWLLDEIAAETGCCERTVRRTLERFKELLERALRQPDEAEAPAATPAGARCAPAGAASPAARTP